MSQNGPVRLEVAVDPTPANGPLSTFIPLNHDPEDTMDDDFAIPEDDDGDGAKVSILSS